MTVEYLLDTNVLVYAASKDPSEAIKARRAGALLVNGAFGLSAQVLQEFYDTVTRKVAMKLTSGEALQFIGALDPAPCAPTDRELVKRSIGISQQFQISYWDGAIIAAAERLSAPIVYSEDLSDGQRYGSVTVINPFK